MRNRSEIWEYLLCAVLFGIALIFASCSQNRTQPKLIFLPVENVERSIDVNISNFPADVRLYFCAPDFSPKDATLIETVVNRTDRIDFNASRIMPDSLETVIFIEDCSGSMEGYIPMANDVIRSAVSQFGDVEVGLIRIGKNAIWAQKPIPAQKFVEVRIDSLPYPKPNGTSIYQGFRLALGSAPSRHSLIVVIADGSILWDSKLMDEIDNAATQKIPVIALQIGGNDSKALRNIAFKSNGYFAGADEVSIPDIIFNGWQIKYIPAVQDTDGAKHQVVLRWRSHRRVVAYSAPGSPKPKITKATHNQIPVELIVGIRIPFVKPDNVKPISPTLIALDSLVGLIEKALLPPGSILQIDGYTCNLGNSRYNYDLSLRRAKVVADFVRRNCKIPVQFEIYAHGEEDPLLPNTSERNRCVNRRVEARIVPEPLTTSAE